MWILFSYIDHYCLWLIMNFWLFFLCETLPLLQNKKASVTSSYICYSSIIGKWNISLKLLLNNCFCSYKVNFILSSVHKEIHRICVIYYMFKILHRIIKMHSIINTFKQHTYSSIGTVGINSPRGTHQIIHLINLICRQNWWHKPWILELGWVTYVDLEFKAMLSNMTTPIVRYSLKTEKLI